MKANGQENIIYALSCPISGDVKYVGKTKNLRARLTMHICAPCNQLMREWIEFLSSNKLKPKIKVLEKCGHNWSERERFHISKMRMSGFDLLNRTNGGGGDIKPTPRQIEERRFKSVSHMIHKEAKEYLGHTPGAGVPVVGDYVASCVFERIVSATSFKDRHRFYLENSEKFSAWSRKRFKVAIWYPQI